MTTLPISSALAVLTLLAFWPHWGLFWRWRSTRDLRRRAQREDALKYVYHCEYHSFQASVESISGMLRITRSRTAALLERMREAGLLDSTHGELKLTGDGRTEALRVVRVHRLWERYLAEQTGMPEAYWHDEADKREHTLTPAEVEDLAAEMGDPRFDPHGAPIPTPTGDIRPAFGQRLASIEPGRHATIVYVEDEPRTVNDRLIALGLTVGRRIEAVGVSDREIALKMDGRQIGVSPLLAANVLVEPAEAGRTRDGALRLLSQLKFGQNARVVDILPGCRGVQRHRLLDLGLVPGTLVRVELQSPGGDPTAYMIRGALIALRRRQAEQIQITLAEDGET